jgi:predicted TIM-barrel fold metal-dependent hydrolase
MKRIFFILSLTVFAKLSAQEADKKAIDVHCHLLPPVYLEELKKHGAEMEDGLPLPEWNAEAHLKFMSEAGIETAVISLSSPQPYFDNAEESQLCIRKINEAAAELKRKYPDRFKFCAALPLPDVKAAIKEAIYALDTLHADGIKLASNSRGQYLGDAALDTLMSVLNGRNAVIMIHPHRPTPQQENVFTSHAIALYEYPAETTRAVINMLSRNILVRFPNLKVIVPHTGSFLPFAIPRMRAIYPILLKNNVMQQIDIQANLSRLYYDLAGSPTPEMLKMLLTITQPEHIMYGSDYPFIDGKILAENLRKMRSYIAADRELAPYAEMFFRTNTLKLFTR